MRKVEFFKHNLGSEEIAKVTEVLNTPILTTGEQVREFEETLAGYLGCRHAVGLTSCTGALHLALLTYDIGPGDEVITTPMSFAATANAVLQAGATPTFVDVEPQTGNVDAELIERAITPSTKAILPVHLYGQMCDMKRIRELADQHALRVIEDAAHALEAERDGVRPGQLSDVACFSFYATKSISSGEGGAAVTNETEVADDLKRLRLHGLDSDAADRYSKRYQHWDMRRFGWKYNMDNIQAALLLPQMEHLEERWRRREDICRRYEDAFSGTAGLEFPEVLAGSRSARNIFSIWVDPERRDEMIWLLQERGIGVAVNYRPIHLLTYYRETFEYREGMFPVAEAIGSRTISLPVYPKLNDDEVDYVIDVVKDSVRSVSNRPKGRAGLPP